MALGDLTPEGDDSGGGGGKSTHIAFMNPRVAGVGEDGEISEDEAYRHKQEYYDAAKELRNKFGPDINVPVGRFCHAAVEAEKGNTGPLEELFEDITS